MNKSDIPAIIELIRKAFDEIINRLKSDMQEILDNHTYHTLNCMVLFKYD